jgi:hypothetical protein
MENDDEEFVSSRLTVAELDARIEADTERRARQSEIFRAENRALEALIERKRHLNTRLEATLAELRAEQGAIDAEVRRLLTPEEVAQVTGLVGH